MKEKIRKLVDNRLGRRSSIKDKPLAIADRHYLVDFKKDIWYLVGVMDKMCGDLTWLSMVLLCGIYIH